MTDLRKKLIRDCDNLFRKIIYSRDKCSCQRCKATAKQLNCSHFYSRSIKVLRWNQLNAVCLCVGCHFWGHQNPLEFSEWYKNHIGLNAFNNLTLSRSNRFRTSESNLEIMKLVLETDLEKIKINAR